ncbi:MAG TPA: phage tail tip lysozyme [Candidatus Dormibacteraeota bacterium]|nr:phage tail tip lysozyme [Candidatus Dormibacteraeota bacterium]
MALSPKEVYQDLINAGASTTQSIGIMANMINESGFDPEAKGDQGTSFGLVQQHGNYGYLVTGNPSADAVAQIKEMISLGGLSAASGSTGAQAAGNFAAGYERCVGCQPGGAQYNSRVANAATVENWISTGKWPQSAGNPATGANTATAGLFGGIGDIFTGPFEGILGWLGTHFLNALGLPSLKDLVERLGLILLGFALVLIGIHVLFASGGSTPINITTETSAKGERTTTRRVNAPGVKHTSVTKSAARGGESVGAGEALEAAAVALRDCFRRWWFQGQEQADRESLFQEATI